VRLVESVLAPAESRELEPVGQAEVPAFSIIAARLLCWLTVFVLDLKKARVFSPTRLAPRARAPRDRTQSIYANARCLAQVNAYNKNREGNV
jgi:hypothetical protein